MKTKLYRRALKYVSVARYPREKHLQAGTWMFPEHQHARGAFAKAWLAGYRAAQRDSKKRAKKK